MPEAKLTLYGTLWCIDCKQIKRFLGERRIRYKFIDIDADAHGLATVARITSGHYRIPAIVFEDGSTHSMASFA